MSTHADSKPWTVPALADAKREGRRLVMLTAYDNSFARVLDANGVDLVLIGDSLGMVVQGHDSTLPVTVDDIVYHTRAVARGLNRALLVSDLPFQSDATPERALDAAIALLQAGAEMVKLEGAGHKLEVIRFLAERDIPVCAHLGLTPQSVLKFGGYRVQGRDEAAAARLREEARAVAEAGAQLLVLECLPSSLAAAITADLAIPTIGIGASATCDGQILVSQDMLGLFDWTPKFVRKYADLRGEIDRAVASYADDVKARRFPAEVETYFSRKPAST